MNPHPKDLEARIAALESRVAKLVEKLDRKGPQPVKPEPEAPEGYRRFTLGDRIQKGDMFLRCDGTLEPAVLVGAVPKVYYEKYFRPIANNPEPIAKPRRSPVEIAKSEMEKWGIEGPLSARNALSNLIAELKREGYK